MKFHMMYICILAMGGLFWNLYIFYSRHKMPISNIGMMFHFLKNIHFIMIWHNIWFSSNLFNDKKLIYFVMYDFYFHNDVYNYKKVTSIMVKINIYILFDLCMLHTSSNSKFSWEFIIISTKTFTWFYL